MTADNDFDVERLRAELAQERQMKSPSRPRPVLSSSTNPSLALVLKERLAQSLEELRNIVHDLENYHTVVVNGQGREMLESSLRELSLTVDELEKRIENVDKESNEWKTRFETQVELNNQLERQSLIMATKVEESKRSLKDMKMPKSMSMGVEEDSEITPHYVRALEREKQVLERQLRDLEWRTEQESKAYYRATEERQNYITEIGVVKGAIYNMRTQQRAELKSKQESRTPRAAPSGVTNIPQDQRIIDPRKGPIRKSAAVKTLPRIN